VTQLEEILDILQFDHLFLTGGAGTGKSYLTNEVIAHYRASERQVVALGSTGVSAVNINGFTIHSFFAFGISGNFDELSQSDKRNRKRLTDLKKILKATDLIVIDEISMVSTDLMDMILYRLESYNYTGKLMLVGDFYQLPPIVKRGSGSDLFGGMLYAFESTAWQRIEPITVELTEMKRTQDAEFTHILGKIRKGVCDEEVERYCFSLANHETDESRNPTHLYGRNLEVEQLNRARLNELPTEETILFAHLEKFGAVYEKRLDTWKKLLPVSEQLTLKVGVPVLFTVNKWGSFVNGERGILRTIEEDHLIVEKSDAFVRVERHAFDLLDMVVHDDGKVEQLSLATLSQFPLKLAYAVTIHKSQGMSIDDLVCNVDNIFAPSQFYVAISRATDPKRLRLDFSRGNLALYLHKVIHVDARVEAFYAKGADGYRTEA
jgi:ATP-dependent exoDNAse (exonuclease V) alpha subunit